MVERQPVDVEYTLRQQDGAWVWEITEQARVLASGCSPTEADARAQALSRRRKAAVSVERRTVVQPSVGRDHFRTSRR